MTSRPLCVTCRWFFKDTCRRYPPQAVGLIPVQQQAVISQQSQVGFHPHFSFPPVSEGTWCGEHDPTLVVNLLNS